jgi:hypothetical protein
MAAVRSRGISTKVTEEDCRTFVERAGLDTVSAWARSALIAAAYNAPTALVLTAEVMALRTIVLRMQYALAHGEALTAETMQQIVDRADAEKLVKAQQRLAQGRPNRPA